MSNTTPPPDQRSLLQNALVALQDMEERLKRSEEATQEPIAVIGMGCRFPGDADHPEAYWNLLKQGVHAVTEVPEARWDADTYLQKSKGGICTRYGGFLRNVDGLDASFFRIAPREAESLDPQHRIALEVAWEALEDAGQPADSLAGSPTGVFIGITGTDYLQRQLLFGNTDDIDAYFTSGNALNFTAGRISYLLGLQGPSLAVDTACSSSLVAIHLACQSLRLRECRMVITGGVNLMLSPATAISFSSWGMLSKDSRCKTFDASADGFVRGEGCGMVVLKRLSDAQADGDRILAILRASAANQDGPSSGLLVPNPQAQQAVIREALQRGKVNPSQVGYVETHGTGTPIGDPIELRALGAVFGNSRSEADPLLVGSVKTNFGHLECAAGVAGLIKAVLAVERGAIPPHLHFQTPTPAVEWDELRLAVPTQLTPWTAERRIAGVSAFGASGTNAHILVENAPSPTPTAAAENETPAGWRLLPLSAKSPEALRALAKEWISLLRGASSAALDDLIFTASRRRAHLDHRLTVTGANVSELADKLESFTNGDLLEGVATGLVSPGRKRKVAFIFPGQGGQWLGMGRELLRKEPIFRDSLQAIDAAIRAETGWSLLEELEADPATSRLTEIDVVQPVLFAIEVALAELWRSHGVKPQAMVGHSMGEVAAACVSGALSLTDAVAVICRRSKLLRRISGQGLMAMVDLPMDQVGLLLKGHEHAVSVAASNSPRATVLAGAPEAIQSILEDAQRRGIFCRQINVDVASHSPQVDPLQGELAQALASLTPKAAALSMHSTVTGEKLRGHELTGAYWIQNLRQPVRLSQVLQQLISEGYDTFLEVSPHPVLLPSLQQCLQEFGSEGSVSVCGRRNEPEEASLLSSLGQLHAAGVALDWSRLAPAGRTVRIPTYPWQRERYWLELPDAKTAVPRGTWGHPLLGEGLQSAQDPNLRIWERDLSSKDPACLADHRVQGRAILPAAAYLEMILNAGTQAFGTENLTLEQVSFSHMMALPETGRISAQTVLRRKGMQAAEVQVFSRKEGEEVWQSHASALLGLATTPSQTLALEAIQTRCQEAFSPDQLYHGMAERGLEYGPSFRGVTAIWRREGEALGRLAPTEEVVRTLGAYRFHPALLDAALQIVGPSLPLAARTADQGDTFLPMGIQKVRTGPGNSACAAWSHVQVNDSPEPGLYDINLSLFDEESQEVLALQGLQVRRLDRGTSAPQDALAHWFLGMEWTPAPLPERDTDEGTWLVFADEQGLGQALAERIRQGGGRCVKAQAGPNFHEHTPDHFTLDVTQPDHVLRVLTQTLKSAQTPLKGVVHTLALDAVGMEACEQDIRKSEDRICLSAIHLVQALNQAGFRDLPRLWLTTAGAQGAPRTEAPLQHLLWGLGRVITHEHPSLRCTRIDVDPQDLESAAIHLWRELASDLPEEEVLWRGAQRWIGQLTRRPAPPLPGMAVVAGKRPAASEHETFRLEIPHPGSFEGLALRETRLPDLGEGDVEIQVEAAGLNFSDVLKVMGLYPGLEGQAIPLGGECAGRIVALGSGVTGLRVGDRVAGFASCAFASRVRTSASAIRPIPNTLQSEEAATLPVVFSTAYYALFTCGRLKAGERVLIHSAAGGVGLAAVQLAQRAGAQVLATAGTPEKREYLRALGVRHVFDSRSLAFVDGVKEATGDQGVDVVLNALPGDAIPASMSLLCAHGRFLEIGKRDIYQDTPLPMGVFRNNVSFFAIDLDAAFRAQPSLGGDLLEGIFSAIAEGTLKPLPRMAFDLAEASEGFRKLAQGQHIGKVVFRINATAPVDILASTEDRVRGEGTYLVTGGTKGLGLAVAQWLVSQGAKHLALVSRRPPGPEALLQIEQLRQRGAQVLFHAADVSKESDVQTLLERVRRELPSLRGIVHSAAVLEDGVLMRLNRDKLHRVTDPKVLGSWWLHRHTLRDSLDFFVLFSSAAALLGSSGQGNYAAANAFMDGLAEHRRTQGLPALSIQWGAWSDIGLAAEDGKAAFRGFETIAPDQGLEALARLLVAGPAQTCVTPFDLRQWFNAYPRMAESSRFARLAQERAQQENGASQGAASPLRGMLANLLNPKDKIQALEQHAREQVAKVLRLDPSRVGLETAFGSLGFDSLLALELRNRLESSTGLRLPATLIWAYPTVRALAAHLGREMGVAAPESPEEAPPTSQEEDARVVQELSDALAAFGQLDGLMDATEVTVD